MTPQPTECIYCGLSFAHEHVEDGTPKEFFMIQEPKCLKCGESHPIAADCKYDFVYLYWLRSEETKVLHAIESRLK